jgi:membrane protein
LFFINTVFIGLATFLGVRLMKFTPKVEMDKTRFAKVRKYIIAVVVLTMLPATYITFNIIRDSLSDRRIQHFVKAELNFPGTYILSHSVDAKTKIISIVAVGKEISKAQQRSSEQQLKEYSLEKYQLHFIQGTESDSLMHQQGHTFAKQQAMTPEQLAQQKVQIEGLQQQLSGYQSLEQNTPAILQEMQPLFTSVSSLALSQLAESKMHEDSMVCVRTMLALVGTKGSLSRNERQMMQRWLKARLKVDSVQVVLK